MKYLIILCFFASCAINSKDFEPIGYTIEVTRCWPAAVGIDTITLKSIQRPRIINDNTSCLIYNDMTLWPNHNVISGVCEYKILKIENIE